MIQCVPHNSYPTDNIIEQVTIEDLNGFEWEVAQVDNGYFIIFKGDPYFSESNFMCLMPDNSYIRINNTNCLFFNNTDYQNIQNVCKFITEYWTDDIWEVITDLLIQRLITSPVIHDCELS